MKRILIAASMLAVATPAMATTTIQSDAATGTNYLGVSGATTNISFDQQAGTVFEAGSKGYAATITGANASRSVVASGLTPYGVFAVAPNPYDGNGYFAIGNGVDSNGVQNSLTLLGKTALSSISVFIGSLDAYNTIQLLGASGNVLGTYTGTDMAGGSTIPFPGNTLADNNRRVTFTGTQDTTYYGAKFYNTGQNSAFEFDNVSLTAAVPEPATWAMMILGFGLVGSAMRRRKPAVAAQVSYAV